MYLLEPNLLQFAIYLPVFQTAMVDSPLYAQSVSESCFSPSIAVAKRGEVLPESMLFPAAVQKDSNPSRFGKRLQNDFNHDRQRGG